MLKRILKSFCLWFLALIITLGSAIYQRKTGPTYPIDGNAQLSGSTVEYSLTRSHGGEGDQPVTVSAPDSNIKGTLVYRRYKTNDAWTEIKMIREDENLKVLLPHQPPAGKLEYHLVLQKSGTELYLPSKENVVTRFKGSVPKSVLFPHIFFMFLAMLVSTRTGLEALRPHGKLPLYVIWTACLLFVGGMILGPIVQRYAFGAFWTGIPFGTDLTDNKTLIAMITWIVALFAVIKRPKARGLVFGASVILLLVYLIPHSMHGSELDYSEHENGKQNIEQTTGM